MVESTGQNQEAEEVEVSPEVFQENSALLMNDAEYSFSVTNPTEQGGTTYYDVKGTDSQGQWEGKKRYSEFDTLYTTLVKRWPCIPIPQLPPKKAVGNKDTTFLQDRQFYLQRWLRKTSRFSFLIDSVEFQAFSRPAPGMKIDAALGKLMPQTTNAKYEQLSNATQCKEEDYAKDRREALAIKIIEFVTFTKKVEPQIKAFRNTLAKQVTTKHTVNVGYGELAQLMQRYEENNLQQYVEFQSKELVFNNPENQGVKAKQDKLQSLMRNPYIDLYQWCKGEMYDLAAVQTAIQTRKDYMEMLRNLQSKKTSTQKNLDNAAAGKKNITGGNDASALATQLESNDREIQQMQKLCDWQTCYLGDVVMSTFKKEKGELYKRLIQSFSVNEIQNSHNIAQLYSDILQLEKIKAH